MNSYEDEAKQYVIKEFGRLEPCQKLLGNIHMKYEPCGSWTGRWEETLSTPHEDLLRLPPGSVNGESGRGGKSTGDWGLPFYESVTIMDRNWILCSTVAIRPQSLIFWSEVCILLTPYTVSKIRKSKDVRGVGTMEIIWFKPLVLWK